MGMLNKQKNIQIAAMNAKGMTVEAIAKKAGVDVQAVKESLEQRGRDYIELAAMSEVQKREYIDNLQSKGKSVSEIAELTGLNAKKVNEIIFKKAEEELPEVGNVEIEPAAPGKRGGHNKISELIKAKIVELKQQGKSDAAVAKELGIGKSSVYRTWTEHKGEGKPSKINEEFEKAVDEMIEESKNKDLFEQRLIELRGERSRHSVAKDLFLKDQTLEKYEKGETLPNIEKAVEIAQYYGVSTDYLLGLTDVKTTNTDIKAACEYTGLNEEFEKAVDEMIEESKNKEIIEEREEMPKEKAPEAEKAAPNAEEKVLQDKDSTLLRKCQEELPLIEKDFLTMYEGMTEAEQRAWDLGEMFARVIRLRSEFI